MNSQWHFDFEYEKFITEDEEVLSLPQEWLIHWTLLRNELGPMKDKLELLFENFPADFTPEEHDSKDNMEMRFLFLTIYETLRNFCSSNVFRSWAFYLVLEKKNFLKNFNSEKPKPYPSISSKEAVEVGYDDYFFEGSIHFIRNAIAHENLIFSKRQFHAMKNDIIVRLSSNPQANDFLNFESGQIMIYNFSPKDRNSKMKVHSMSCSEFHRDLKELVAISRIIFFSEPSWSSSPILNPIIWKNSANTVGERFSLTSRCWSKNVLGLPPSIIELFKSNVHFKGVEILVRHILSESKKIPDESFHFTHISVNVLLISIQESPLCDFFPSFKLIEDIIFSYLKIEYPETIL